MSNKKGTPLSSILPAPVYGALKGMVSDWVDADQLILPDEGTPPKMELLTIREVQEQLNIKRHCLWRLLKRSVKDAETAGNPDLAIITHRSGPARSARVWVDRASLLKYLRRNSAGSDS